MGDVPHCMEQFAHRLAVVACVQFIIMFPVPFPLFLVCYSTSFIDVSSIHRHNAQVFL